MSQFPTLEWSPENSYLHDPATGRTHGPGTPAEVLAAAANPAKINLALSRRQSFVKPVRLPDVPRAEALALLRFRLPEFFPIDPAELAYDAVPTPDVSSEGRLFLVCAAKAETLRQAQALVRHLGAKTVHTVPVALGAPALAPQNPGPALFLTPAAGGLAYDLVQDGALLNTRVDPYPQTTEELESQVARTLAAAKLTLPPTDVPLYVDPSLRDIAPPRAVNTTGNAREHAAAHAVDLRLPEEVAKAALFKVMARRRLAVLLAAAAFCAWALAWWDRDDQQRLVDRNRSLAEVKLRQLREREGQIKPRLENLATREGFVVDGLDPRQHLADILTVATNATPEGLWLTGLNLERGKPLQARGVAKNNNQVAAFVDSLSASQRLRDVKLVFSNNNSIGDVPVVQFSVTAHVVGNFPLAEPQTDSRDRNRSRR